MKHILKYYISLSNLAMSCKFTGNNAKIKINSIVGIRKLKMKMMSESIKNASVS